MNDTIKKSRFPLIVFCVILLLNPCFSSFDFFPDWIAWFLLASLLRRPSLTLPSFAALKKSLEKLAYLSLAKIPAVFFIVTVRGTNTSDRDVFTLVSLTFSAIQILLSILALRDFRDCMNAIADHGGPPALYSDRAHTFSLIFILSHCLLYFLPDTLLLYSESRPVSPKKYLTVELYAMGLSLAVGIVWAVFFLRYLRRAMADPSFREALDRMVGTDSEDFHKREHGERITAGFSLLAFSSLLSYELIFSDVGELNLLPHFLYAALLFAGIQILQKQRPVFRISAFLSAGYLAACIASFAFSVKFYGSYSYAEIAFVKEAEALYRNFEIFSIAEAVLLIAVWTSLVFALRKFLLSDTGISPASERYNLCDKEFHRDLSLRAISLSVLAAGVGIAKTVSVFLRARVVYIRADETDLASAVVRTTEIPWFPTFVFALCTLYAVASFGFFGRLKDEFRSKHDILY